MSRKPEGCSSGDISLLMELRRLGAGGRTLAPGLERLLFSIGRRDFGLGSACAKARLNKTPSAVKTVFVLRFLAARPESCPFKTETRVEFFINLSETSVSLSLRKHLNRGQAEQSVPQRLKPRSFALRGGTDKSVPFQNQRPKPPFITGAAGVLPFQNQRLKPRSFIRIASAAKRPVAFLICPFVTKIERNAIQQGNLCG